MSRYKRILVILSGHCIFAPVAISQASARIEGTVFDSVHMIPLFGATLVASRSPVRTPEVFHAARSDGAGRFLIDGLDAGSYTISVEHSLFDSLGINLETSVQLAAGKSTSVVVATPSRRTLMQRLCTPAMDNSAIGVVMGVVRTADAAPVRNASVTLAWNELAFDAAAMRVAQKPMHATVETDSVGVYRGCGVPTATAMIVAARTAAGGETALHQAEISPTGLLILDLAVRGKKNSAATHVVRGRVTQTNGTPVPSARVTVGEGDEHSTASDESGYYQITDVGAGVQGMQVIALGYAPRTTLVEVSDHDLELNVTMDRVAVVLDSMSVTAVSRGSRYMGFEQRQLFGNGYFMTEERITELRPMSNADLMKHIAGVQVVHQRAKTVMAKGGGAMRGSVPESTYVQFRGGCPLEIYVDGVHGSALDLERIPPSQIHGLEIHDIATTPAEYHSRCGVLLIWTK